MYKILLPIIFVFILQVQNNIGQTFTKITTGRIPNDGGTSTGANWIDYNNDGYLDLFVANLGEDNFLYTNNGDGTFTKIISGDIVNDGIECFSGSWGDFNNDGNIDLFIANTNGNNLLYINNSDNAFTLITSGIVVEDGGGSTSGSWGDFDNDGDLDLYVTNLGENNFLYTNNGDSTFTKVTNGDPVNDGGDSYCSNWVDIDGDNDLDLFVTNIGEKNFMYVNNGNGTFTKIFDGEIVNDTTFSRGSSWGDFDNDGDLDLYVTNSNSYYNSFYSNNNDGTFKKIKFGIVVNCQGNSRGSSWGDCDNDGDLDLFITNTGQNNILYLNNGNGIFTEYSESAVFSDWANTYGCSWGDYDNDGDLDLFVSCSGNNFLYQNDGTDNNWINILCVGTTSNCSAIGAKVRVKSVINGKSVWQMRQIFAQSGYWSQNSLNVEFGIGNSTIIDSLLINWPTGLVEIHTNIAVNQFITAIEQQGITIIDEKDKRVVNQFNLMQNYPNPFNPNTTIEFDLPKTSEVTLKVFNILGEEITTLVSDKLTAGGYSYDWDASNIASGVYLYRLEAKGYVETKKMILIQ